MTIEVTNDETAASTTGESSIDDKLVYLNEEGEIIVDDEHPEIRLTVERALEELNSFVITLSPNDYISTLRNELEVIRKERLRLDSTAAMLVLFYLIF